MSTKLPPGEISAKCAKILETARLDQGVSLRQLGALSGVDFSRARRALLAERPFLMDDFVDICRALGLRASTVLREVEAELHTPALPPEWELAALDVDPRTLDGGLDPARGEEPQ